MIVKIAMNLVGQMTEEKLIDENMANQYIYVLVSWIEKVITVSTIILISIAVHMLLPTLFFLIFFLALRKRTGGYHLDYFYQCYLATVVSYLFVLFISSHLAKYPKLLFGILFLAMMIIGIIGTVNHPNMNMDSEELKESKKAARIIVLLEGIIICSYAQLGADMVIISYIAMAVILCAALLCIAKILKQEVKMSEESEQEDTGVYGTCHEKRSRN